MDSYSDYLNPSPSAGQKVPDQQPQQDQGAGGGLVSKWNDFMSEPANRAGLMQFGINMLAGQGLAGGLGGFGEASSRNLAAQEEQEQREAELALKERGVAAKESEVASYGIAARRRAEEGDTDAKYIRRANYQTQIDNDRAWRKWAGTPDDLVSTDPVREYVNSVTGHKYNSKAEIMQDPRARQLAHDYHFGQYAGGGGPPVVYRGNTPVGHYVNGKFVPGEPTE